MNTLLDSANNRTMHSRVVVAALGVAANLAVVVGAQSETESDWVQWRGADRAGVSEETGLLPQWPDSGPPVVWTTEDLGSGYGAVSVGPAHLFVQGLRGEESVVSSLSIRDGREVWSTTIGVGGHNGQGSGPRSTPTVDGDRLYVLTETGDLACLRTRDGTVVWQRNILEEFGSRRFFGVLGGRNIQWLISESPLVDGEHVIVTPGGRGAGMVALDKMSGETIWMSEELSDRPGYSSVIAADVDGVRTLMTLTAAAGIGVRASDGKLMWRYDRAANQTANVTTPVFHENKVFYSSAYGTGSALLELTGEGGEVTAKEVYFTRQMQNHHGGVVLVDGYLYGFSNSILTCLEFATGKLMWRHRSVGKGSLIYADDHLYVVGENNTVGLVEATPAEYREKGRFRTADSGWPSWAHPVVSGGRLYIRNQGSLTAYDIRAN